jgi:hypothetical protein
MEEERKTVTFEPLDTYIVPIQSDTTEKIDKALALAQGKILGAKKQSKNPFFNSDYADLHQVIETVRKPLSEAQISYTQPCRGIEIIGKTVFLNVETTLRHAGEFITTIIPVPVDNPVNAHKLGSALTYGRRYGLASMCGVSQMDDDGNAAVTTDVAPHKRGGVTKAHSEKMTKQTNNKPVGV